MNATPQLNEAAEGGSSPVPYSAAEDAARKSKICICGKPMNEGLRPHDEGGPVCWDCFKYRTDVTPYKYFHGSYDEWVMGLPNANVDARRDKTPNPSDG